MLKHLLSFCGIAFCLACAGCKTHTPMVQNHQATYQQKAEAADHWRQMTQALCDKLANQKNLAGKTIYLEPPPPGGSSFDVAYWKMLKAELVTASWRVVEAPEQAQLQLAFDSQLVPHGERQYLSNPTTLFSALGFDLVHFFGGDSSGYPWETQRDLLVTIFVRENAAPLFGTTQIVYVPAADTELYLSYASSAVMSYTPGTLHPADSWQQVEARARRVCYPPAYAVSGPR